MKKVVVLFVLLVASASFAQIARPTVYIDPQHGVETYLAAARTKKNVPIDIVTDASKATYILRTAAVEVKSETIDSKLARCLSLYCAEIEDKVAVSVLEGRQF